MVINLPVQFRLVANLANVDCVTEIVSAPLLDSASCGKSLPKGGSARPMLPVLAQINNVCTETIAALHKSGTVGALPRPPKSDGIAYIADDWVEPLGPTSSFNDIVTALPEAQASTLVRVSTIMEWERAVRVILGNISYKHHSTRAFGHLIGCITKEGQDLKGLQDVALTMLYTTVQYQRAIIAQSCFMLSSFTVLRRDRFLACLSLTAAKIPDLAKRLRLCALSDASLFGEEEEIAVRKLHLHNRQSAHATMAVQPRGPKRAFQAFPHEEHYTPSKRARNTAFLAHGASTSTDSYALRGKPFSGGRPHRRREQCGRGAFIAYPTGAPRGRGYPYWQSAHAGVEPAATAPKREHTTQSSSRGVAAESQSVFGVSQLSVIHEAKAISPSVGTDKCRPMGIGGGKEGLQTHIQIPTTSDTYTSLVYGESRAGPFVSKRDRWYASKGGNRSSGRRRLSRFLLSDVYSTQKRIGN